MKKLMGLVFLFPGLAMADVWHVVAFRFKDDPKSLLKIPAVVQAFSDLQELSLDSKGRKLIESFHYGKNNSLEQVSFGKKGAKADRSTEYTFVMKFRTVADRDYYVDLEPAHQKFKALVGPLLEGGIDGVFVTDFEE